MTVRNRRNALAVPVIVLALLVLWYVAAVPMNAGWTYSQAARQGLTPSFTEVVADTMNQDRPRLPLPHQILGEMNRVVLQTPVTSRQSLIYHAAVTLGATLSGFLLSVVLGLGLATAAVRFRVMDQGFTPWAIISQTIPIVALAPMIVVLSSKLGIDGRLVPKTLISAYLGFFPIYVSMLKGLRSPDSIQLDLMHTYAAGGGQVFRMLRLPASLPYFFAAMKISMAASLVGVIIGELPTGAAAGLGARLLIGSQNGQPLMIWSALVMASLLGALLILVVGMVEKLLVRATGGVPGEVRA